VEVLRQKLLLNVPYGMVRPRLQEIVALRMGIEVYISNEAVEEVESKDARDLGAALAERGITCTCHGPYMDLSPGGVDRQVRSISLEKLKKAVSIAHLIGAKGMVCHGGYDKWRFGGHEELWLENSTATWTDLLAEAGDLPLMIENVFEETPSTIIALLERFREKNLWSCFDTGHFNLFTLLSLEEWLLPLRKRLREIHIHDNHGKSDEHLPVGRGTFPFRELKLFLKTLDNLFFTAEIAGESSAEESIKRAKEFLS
jgi:sugar phosphate isomerase/epimerase